MFSLCSWWCSTKKLQEDKLALNESLVLMALGFFQFSSLSNFSAGSDEHSDGRRKVERTCSQGQREISPRRGQDGSCPGIVLDCRWNVSEL